MVTSGSGGDTVFSDFDFSSRFFALQFLRYSRRASIVFSGIDILLTMQKVAALEKTAKLQEQKQTRAESKQISDELKPHKAKRTHFKMPSTKHQLPQLPARKYREYRSVILPSIGAGTWWIYRNIAEHPTDDDYQKIMGSIVASQDLNELIQDQLTLFGESDGLGKIALTALSKVLEVSG